MRIHSITVRNYRRHKNLRVDLDPSRTLIGGPNESGKSTLVEAAHRALFLKAKGKSELHRRMESQTHGGKPEVELEFEAAGHSYTLVKNFKGTGGTARLTQTSGPTWQGDQAEEKLSELLNTGGSVKAAEFDRQWGHLWVWQGGSSNDPLETIGQERDSLVQKLQAKGGAAVIQSALDTQVAASFSARVKAMFKESGELKTGQDSSYGPALFAEHEANQQVEQAQAALSALSQAVTQQEQAIDQLGKIQASLKDGEAELAALEYRGAEITKLRLQFQEQMRLAEEAGKICTQREEAEQKVSQTQHQLRTAEAALAPQSQRLADLKQEAASARTRATTAEEAYLASDKTLHQARQRHELAQVFTLLTEKSRLRDSLLKRQEMVQVLLQKRQILDIHAKQIPKVDASVLRHLHALEKAQDKAQAVLDSLATGVEVLASVVPVLADGKPIQTGHIHTLTTETELSAGSTRLRIRPGGGNTLDDCRKLAQETHRAMEDALAGLGLKNIAEASTAQARREELQTEAKTLAAELKGLAADGIEAELASATQEQMAAQAEVDRRSAYQPEVLAHESIAVTQTNLDTAQRKQQEAQHLLNLESTAVKKAETAVTLQAESMRTMEHEILNLKARLGVLIERDGDEPTRAKALEAARMQKDAADLRLNEIRQQLNQHQPEYFEADMERNQRARKIQLTEKSRADEQRISSAALLRRDGSSDPAAALALAKARLHSAITHRQTIENHAQALRRVHDLLKEEQQALADQFTRPLAERVGGYLQRLFGQDVRVDVTLQDNQFQGLSLSRKGEGAFSFDTLSNGAREQVAAAFRLALAEILAESYGGALPVVFDDAFAHSDPERVRQLQQMLDLAATRGLQIILLTCTPTEYSRIGAKTIHLG